MSGHAEVNLCCLYFSINGPIQIFHLQYTFFFCLDAVLIYDLSFGVIGIFYLYIYALILFSK